MKILVSFHRPSDGKTYEAIKKSFHAADGVEVYGRNLTNHFKRGAAELHSDPAKLDDRLSRPDLAIILLSPEYLRDHWLSNEVTALLNLENFRRRKNSLVLPILTANLPDRQIPQGLRTHFRSEIDFRNGVTKGLEALASYVKSLSELSTRAGRVLIAHGRDDLWKQLRELLEGRLGLSCDEFNRNSIVGLSNKEVLLEKLDQSSFAFAVMTAEDEQADGSKHARQNVVHEIGLCQGRLGFQRTAILLEEGCTEFSNIHGLGQIRFTKSNFAASTELIRMALEAENLL